MLTDLQTKGTLGMNNGSSLDPAIARKQMGSPCPEKLNYSKVAFVAAK